MHIAPKLPQSPHEARWWLNAAIFLSLLLCSGCFQFYRSQPESATVLDAETGQPIAGAKVEIHFIHTEEELNQGLQDASGITDSDGKVTLAGATWQPQEWVASAPGYIKDWNGLSQDYLKDGHRISDTPPTSATIRLYHGPRPTLNLVVPKDFRGPIMIDMQLPTEANKPAPGQRVFTYNVPANGYVLVTIAPVLPVSGYDLHFVSEDEQYMIKIPLRGGNNSINHLNVVVYRDGSAPIPTYDAQPNTIAAREIESRNYHGRKIWVIGTSADAKAVAAKLYTPQKDSPNMFNFNYTAFDALFPVPESSENPARFQGVIVP